MVVNSLFSQWNKIETDYHAIDIPSSSDDEHHNFYGSSYGDSSNDSGNFFFRMTGLVSKFIQSDDKIKDNYHSDKEKKDQYQLKLEEYERKLKELEGKNKEYLNKIQNYECQNIIEFNRKIRSGIPIKFFPCHSSVYGSSNIVSKKEPFSEYDLH